MLSNEALNNKTYILKVTDRNKFSAVFGADCSVDYFDHSCNKSFY